jgi:DNA-binding NarL/FixJ family response regulator
MKTMAISDTAKSFLQSSIETVFALRPFELKPADGDGARLPPPRARLTRRQRDVLALLCEGMTNKDISRELAIGNATVKIHVSGILRALNVTSRLQAAIVARRSGLIADKSRGDAAKVDCASRQPLVLRVVWDGTTAQIIGVDAETVA